ncbi:MAG: LysE/ArgO family amino acid transporter [Micromonosporaceae bacterium]
MTSALVAGLLAGFGIAMPVGAIAAYLVALTARTSFKIGAFAALGIATADGVYAVVATYGGAVLAAPIELIMLPLRVGSAVVLLALAARTAVVAIRRHRESAAQPAAGDELVGPARAYLGLLGLTISNPATVIYFAAYVLGLQAALAPDHVERVVFVLAAFSASASWQLMLAGGGALLGRALTGPRGRLATAIAASTLIAALAVHLLIT